MMQTLTVAHRHKPSFFAEGLVWNTCLRSVAVVDSDFAAERGDKVFNGREAYSFLLELVCGLHSPMIGETEVFGQFKTFANEWVAQEPQAAPLVQRLIGDAKAIRTAYLSQLGNQSYGSWVRKNLGPKVSDVHMIGGGQLAKEILPYVQKRTEKMTMHVRDVKKVDFFKGPVETLHPGGFTGGAVVIAAPVSASVIEAWLGIHAPSQFFDLRETAESDPVNLPASTEAHRLGEIFQQIEKTRERLIPVVQQVRSEIEIRSLKLERQGLLRPQGWDDLSA